MTHSKPVALISGSSSGIGAASAIRLAQTGHDIVLNFSKNADGARQTAAACEAAGAATCTVGATIERDDDCRRLVAAASDRWGRLDVLVNNAAVTRYVAEDDLDALRTEDFARIFAVNVAGTFQLTRAASPLLRASPRGAVVNVSSDAALSASGSSIAYSSSKAAINNMTLSMARVLAPQVRVNAICPGFADTTWALAWQSREDYAKFKDTSAALAPLKVMPTADDVAEAVYWLACKAPCITGQMLVMDAGTHLTAGTPLDHA